MIAFLKHNRLLLIGFAAVLALTIYFGLGAVRHARDVGLAGAEQSVEAWMTTRYVAHSWDLPREVMTGLGFERGTDGPRPLRKIAEERGIPVETLIAEIEGAIALHRAEIGK